MTGVGGSGAFVPRFHGMAVQLLWDNLLKIVWGSFTVGSDGCLVPPQLESSDTEQRLSYERS
jgi:hypothetical protein